MPAKSAASKPQQPAPPPATAAPAPRSLTFSDLLFATAKAYGDGQGFAELFAELRRRTPAPKVAVVHSPLEAAAANADVSTFSVPRSHRLGLAGGLITSAKRALLTATGPLFARLLAGQRDFNLEALRVASALVSQAAEGKRSSDGAWVRAELGAAEARARPSQRGPWAELLQKQARFNARLVELLALSVSPPLPDVTRANALVASLAAECDLARELPGALRRLRPLLAEVLRRQTAFNTDMMLVASDLLHGRPPVVAPRASDYEAWRRLVEPGQLEDARRRLATLRERPLVSLVVPAFNTPLHILDACIESVRAQLYDRWELCIVDDGSPDSRVSRRLAKWAERDSRIRTARLPKNKGIAAATNAAIALSTGDFIAFLDHDDMLAPHALAEMVLKVAEDPTLDWIYSDEDRLTPDGRRENPFFKPDYSPDLLRAVNYICHFVFVRAPLVRELKLRAGFEGSQDFDFLLRLSEKSERVAHIPRILYHWRSSPISLSRDQKKLQAASDAGVRALKEHLVWCGEDAEVSDPSPTHYRIHYRVRGEPLVSIIVPFKDKPELLRQLVETLLPLTRYQNYELLLVSNNSTERATHEYLASLGDARIRKLAWDHPFNYPAINNFAAKQARGELLLFLNNDIEITDGLWLEELISHAQRPQVGMVGPKLLFPDGSVQHAGVVVGLSGYAGHPFWRFPTGHLWTPFGHAEWTRNYLAVTSACVMMRRDLFEQVGGYDEGFDLCGSDVHLGMKVVKAGKRVVYTPHTSLIHHESASRRNNRIPERDYWRSLVEYREWLEGRDPFYNPNLSLMTTDCAIRLDEPSAVELAAQAVVGFAGSPAA